MMSSLAHSAPLQCEYPEIDQTGLIVNAMFNVDLSQFGAVCFVARKVSSPGQVDPSHIKLELFQYGDKIYTLPEPEVPLLYGDDVAAVSFPKLGRDERKSIIILVRGITARAGEYMQPVIYFPEDHGFTPDIDLSLKTANLDTIAKVVSKVKQLLARRNSTHQ